MDQRGKLENTFIWMKIKIQYTKIYEMQLKQYLEVNFLLLSAYLSKGKGFKSMT